jgi:hypothetical protein
MTDPSECQPLAFRESAAPRINNLLAVVQVYGAAISRALMYPAPNAEMDVAEAAGTEAGKSKSGGDLEWYARADSNGRPFAPELSEPPLVLPLVPWNFNNLGHLL